MCVQVWKLGWSPQPGGEYGTTLPEIPVDFLQEKDVFREFLYRINTLGTVKKWAFPLSHSDSLDHPLICHLIVFVLFRLEQQDTV